MLLPVSCVNKFKKCILMILNNHIKMNKNQIIEYSEDMVLNLNTWQDTYNKSLHKILIYIFF